MTYDILPFLLRLWIGCFVFSTCGYVLDTKQRVKSVTNIAWMPGYLIEDQAVVARRWNQCFIHVVWICDVAPSRFDEVQLIPDIIGDDSVGAPASEHPHEPTFVYHDRSESQLRDPKASPCSPFSPPAVPNSPDMMAGLLPRMWYVNGSVGKK